MDLVGWTIVLVLGPSSSDRPRISIEVACCQVPKLPNTRHNSKTTTIVCQSGHVHGRKEGGDLFSVLT